MLPLIFFLFSLLCPSWMILMKNTWGIKMKSQENQVVKMTFTKKRNGERLECYHFEYIS